MNQKTITINTDTPYRFKRIEEDFVSTMLHDELVLMNLKTGDYLGMEKVALTIWELLSEPASLAELVSQLTQKYEVEEQECREEVVRFLNLLQEHDMLEVIE
jgi:hypothetical protein